MTTTLRILDRNNAWLGVPVVGTLAIGVFLALPTGSVVQSAV